ncbi:MAG: MurR/RpiR family transcriptional regulator [Coprobacillaceae bacterium]
MNIFTKLENMQNLTDTEKSFVHYMLHHHHDFMHYSIKELAKQAGLSTSAVYRFCSKLELSGLNELKVIVNRDIDVYLSKNKEIDFNFPFSQNESPYVIVENLEEIYQETIKNASQLLDIEELRLVVQELYNAKTIDVFPSSGNVYVAENFKMQMQEIGHNVIVPVEMYEQYLVAGSTDETHVAIVISYANKYRETLNIVKHLKRNRTKIILVSSPNPSDITPYASRNLFISTKENPYDKISAFTIRLSLQFVFDSIYSCFFKRDYNKNIEYKNKDHIQMIYKENKK